MVVFKRLFILKYIKIIFFYFLKIIFNINISKWFTNITNIKKILIWNKKKIKKFQFFLKTLSKRNAKHT
jgi:hypothetical protein